MTSFWLTNDDNTRALSGRAMRPIIHRLPGPPANSNIPWGLTTRLHADNERFPMRSKSTS